MCSHQPPCPPADRPDRTAARTIADHPDQGWCLLCNGVIVFDDTGQLLPDGRAIPPHRPVAAWVGYRREDGCGQEDEARHMPLVCTVNP